jgi:cytochrome c556
MKVNRLRLLTAVAAVAAVTAIAVVAAEETTAIQQRQEAMGKIGQAMKALGAIAKKEAPFDAEVVKTNAETIASRLKKAAGLFPEGSDQGDVETWAKAEVWSDGEGFRESFEAAITAAVSMQAVTDEAKFPPALGVLGNSCKTCHGKYRRPSQ